MGGVPRIADGSDGDLLGKMSGSEGRGAPVIFLAVFTMCPSVFWQKAEQSPYHTAMQPVRTLSVVPG